MIGEPSRHRGCALFPFAAMRGWAWQSDAHSTMWTHKVVDGIFQGNMTLQEVFLLGMRERLAYQPAIALARSQVIAFDVSGVDLAATGVGLQDTRDGVRRTENDAPPHFNHPTAHPSFIDLRITQVGVEHAFGFFAWTPRSAFERGRLWRTVVGDQGGHIGGQFVTREQGRASRRASLKLGQKRDGVSLTPFMADIAHHAQPTG